MNKRTALVIAIGGLLLGCGMLPEVPHTDDGQPIRVARDGEAVRVLVDGWTRPDVKMVLCARRVPDDQLANLVPWPAQRRDCLEMETVHEGSRLAGTYSFASSSAVRFSAFNASPAWYVVIVGLDQAAPRFSQVRLPGGPVRRD